MDGAAEGLLAALFDAADVFAGAFELLENDYIYLAANRNTASFYDLTPAEIVGRTGRDLEVDAARIEGRLKTLRRCWNTHSTLTSEYPFDHKGREGWFLGTFSPLPGSTPRIGFVLVDITTRKLAELQAEEERQRLRVALQATRLGLWEYRIAEDRVVWDDRMRELFGVSPDAEIDFAVYASRLHPDDATETHRIYEAALAGANGGAFTITHRNADGTRWMRAYGQVLFNELGEPTLVLGTSLDITAEVQAQEQERLLLAELNHRVKNNLATVQSMAVQTARVSSDLPTFLTTFEGRLVSLARTHDVLTARAWSSAEIGEIVRRELESFGGRVATSGPALAVPSGEAVAIGLIVHELATNAAKYGALAAGGDVKVEWSLEGAEARFTWRETGGPPPGRPTRSGFGTKLIVRLAEGDLRGRAAFDYAEQGLRFTLTFPRPARGP